MKDLEAIFRNHSGNLINKWEHYLKVYDRHLSRFRGREIHIVEFGVSHGGSLQMWREYFGYKARITGIDINPACKQFASESTQVFIGDQSDKIFLKSLLDSLPIIDVLIDDGGHSMTQQKTTFEVMFPHIHEQGVYICEDLHTSYWLEFGGGFKRPGSFVEYSKSFIDQINAWHSRSKRLEVSDFTRSVGSLHFYDSILVIEKAPKAAPVNLFVGKETIDPLWKAVTILDRLRRKIFAIREQLF